MNANELAKELSEFMTEDGYTELDKTIFKATTMLRQQQVEIEALKKTVESLFGGLESSLALNKAQAERQEQKTLKDYIEQKETNGNKTNGEE